MIGILAIILAVLIVRQSGLVDEIDALKQWVDDTIVGRGALGSLIFVGVCALFTSFGVSRQLFAFVAGYAFGAGLGSTLALTGEIIGVLMAFSFSRFLARDFVSAKYPARLQRLDAFLADNPFTMTLVVRLMPVGSNLVINLVGGVTRVPVLPFLAATAIGHLPQTIVFALLGSGLADDAGLKTAVAGALFIVSLVLGLHLYRKYRRSMGEPDANPTEPADAA